MYYIKTQEQKIKSSYRHMHEMQNRFIFDKDKFLKRISCHAYKNVVSSQTRFKPISSVKLWLGGRLEVVGFYS